MPSLPDVLEIILGGGRGSRLWPLTKLRAKPAVPIGGKYRLDRHPPQQLPELGHPPDRHPHPVQLGLAPPPHLPDLQLRRLPPWLGPDAGGRADLRQRRLVPGTADAVRKQLFEIQVDRASDVLVLAGDHLYRMDYSALVEYHWAT